MSHRTLQCLSLGVLVAGLSMPAFANHEEKMKKMDADGDGKVSSSEHASGAAQMFAELDTDKNDSVSLAEMEAHMQAKPAPKDAPAMTAHKKIAKVDSNKDGAIGRDEHIAGSASMFAAMDADNDGFLTRSEWSAGHSPKK
jgi:Ca2+-binding EF-hand superfamily protein